MRGGGLGLALLLAPYVLGGMKAGDVKFLAAVGAWVGAAEVLRVFWATLLLYPLFALALVWRERKLRLTLRRFGRVLCHLLSFFAPSFKLYAAHFEANDEPDVASVRTPFGVAIAAGTLLALHTRFLH
jgi:prepilin peptidase CpaA